MTNMITNIPALTGSEKQISWATEIRESYINTLELFVRLSNGEEKVFSKFGTDITANTISGYRSILEVIVGRDAISAHMAAFKESYEGERNERGRVPGAILLAEQNEFLVRTAAENIQTQTSASWWINRR